MRLAPQRVLRGLSKQLVLLLLALAALLLAGSGAGAGVAAGALLAMALVLHVSAFGVAGALAAAPPAALRIVAVAGLALAGAVGLWATQRDAFRFVLARAGDVTLSPGGALMHLAAALVVSGVCGFIFLAVAGRAGAIGEES